MLFFASFSVILTFFHVKYASCRDTVPPINRTISEALDWNLYELNKQQVLEYDNIENHKDLNAKRWVIFNGEIEASKIPPHWHAWLHKSIDEPPLNYSHKYSWQKDHKPNMTGTKNAHFPPSNPISKDYKPNQLKADYESWSP